MYVIRLHSFFRDVYDYDGKPVSIDYEVAPLDMNIPFFKIRNFFHSPKIKLRNRKLEDVVEKLMAHFLRENYFKSEDDIITMDYHLEYDKEFNSLVMTGKVLVKGTFVSKYK